MTIATTDQKARLLDLTTGILEMVRDGNRDIGQVSAVLQAIKDDPEFAARLLAKSGGWPIWRTLTIGGVSKNNLLKRLRDGGFFVSDRVPDIMGQPAFKTSAEPHKVSFVRVEVADLGFAEFANAPTTVKIFNRKRLAGHNLDLCDPEDVLHLLLTFKDQPRGDRFWVGMEPIASSVGSPSVFCVECFDGGEHWLGVGDAYPDDHWGLGQELVFRSRK